MGPPKCWAPGNFPVCPPPPLEPALVTIVTIVRYLLHIITNYFEKKFKIPNLCN